MACLKISSGWDCVLQNWTLLHAFHSDHAIIAHNSNSLLDSLSNICLVSRKKFMAESLFFVSYPEPGPILCERKGILIRYVPWFLLSNHI